MQYAAQSNSRSLIIALPVIFAGLILGYVSSASSALPLFVSGSLVIIICSAIWSAKEEQDWFNPLTVLIVLGLVRFTVPWVLLAVSEPPQSIKRMLLSSANWQTGHALGLLGLLAVILGWHASPKAIAHVVQRGIECLSYRTTSQVVITWAWMIFVLGMVGWVLFVASNAGNILVVVGSGDFRHTTIEEGTGVLFFLALASISGSTLLTSYLIMKYRRLSVVILLPVVANGAAFFVLGGRARSFTPIACALLMAWYVILNHQLNRKWFLRVTALVLLLITFSYAGAIYRGKGLSELSAIFSLSNIIAYTHYAAWLEFGQLHGLAGATKVEPGALGGKSFGGALGLTNRLFGFGSRSSGVIIAQQIRRGGFKDKEKKFGFHSSFIGDSYLNYGYLGVVLLSVFLGALLRSIYRVGIQMLGNPLGLTFYAIAIVYSLRIFFESVSKTLEMQVALCFLVGGLLIVRLFRRDPEHA